MYSINYTISTLKKIELDYQKVLRKKYPKGINHLVSFIGTGKTPFGTNVNIAEWKEVFERTIDVERRSFIEKALENEEDLHGEPRIAISTIHQAKGGEAENVAVYLDLSKAQKRTSMLQPDGLHRQFYVAITRTIDNLYLIQAQDDYYRYVI